MKNTLNLICSILLFCCLETQAQDSTNRTSIILLENEQIANINFDNEKFINSLTPVVKRLDDAEKKIDPKQMVLVQITSHTNKDNTVEVFTNPQNEKLAEQLKQTLSNTQTERSKLVDYAIGFLIHVNATENPLESFPNYKSPLVRRMLSYQNADIKSKILLNKSFATSYALPIISNLQSQVEDKFVGVKTFGTLMAKTNLSDKINIKQNIDLNQYYWRGNMEMSIGNLLIPASKIFALVANGELDYAKRYMEILYNFSSEKTLVHGLFKELNMRLNEFHESINTEITNGIVLHDKGKYEAAIKSYQNILNIYPNSAWGLYELYFSKNALLLQQNKIKLEDRHDWDEAKVAIYQHDPLYNLDVRSKTGKEAYIAMRRMEIKDLFKEEKKYLGDVFTYGEIAMDLGSYDFAAQLFWLCTTFDKENKEKSLNYYFYALEKLGTTQLKNNFKMDFDQIFKDIDDKRLESMKSHPIYKSMKTKD